MSIPYPNKGPAGQFTQNIRSLGTTGRQVEINLQNNDRHFYIKQNQFGGAELYYEDALQFISDGGNNQPRLDFQLSNNGTAIFYQECQVHKNFYLKSDDGSLWHIKVNNNGSLQTIKV